MKRSFVSKCSIGTPEYVVLHARWQRSRGRNPSASFIGCCNPKKALALAERMAYFPVNEDYLKDIPIPDYKCAHCEATGCKLWREYQTFSPKLLCARCAASDQNKDISDIDEKGMRTNSDGRKTDQIGWFVPAVPTEEGFGYWGYTSVPQSGCDWWDKLPTLPKKTLVEA